ncbi:MAG: T9SS type A sorting domain-containing protein [Saprospiraceae bacterium]|nr:T9SS type A sorting domain-containing protein [Saprospiraceae bacterium]
MRKLLVLLPTIFYCFSMSIAQHCATDEFFQKRIINNPNLIIENAEIERFTQQWIFNITNSLTARSVITIPVVVHIVWKETEENISDEQIRSQMDVLNRDFRAMNSEIPTVPAIFKSTVADVEIEFCLASRDPQGNATNGITRTKTNISQIGTEFINAKRAICFTDLGGHDAWDTEKYLNIWVGKSHPIFIGEAEFPGMAEPGEDGIRMDPAYFGTTGTVSEPFHLGRTLTHEIGHYLNLLHPWGISLNDPDCSSDDEVSDTPRQSSTFRGECPPHPQVFCGTASMFMNFMNYTDDACLAMFSKGQKMRMLATLNGIRSGLLSSIGCQPPVSAGEEPLWSKQIQVIENPVKSAIRLESNIIFNKEIFIRLVNSQGQLLFTEKWINGSIWTKDVGTLPNGIYFLILQNSNTIFTKKIILIN